MLAASPGTLPLVASSEAMSVIPIQRKTWTSYTRNMLYVALVASIAWSAVVKKVAVVSTLFGSVDRKSQLPRPVTRRSEANTLEVSRGVLMVGSSERQVHAHGDRPSGREDPEID